MSYDVCLVIDTGGEFPVSITDNINHTSNTSGMWHAALGHSIRDLKGMNAAEAIPRLERAVAYLRDPAHKAELRAMTPMNRWGTVETATTYLAEILEMCKKHPKAQIWMSY